jgi:hypothetical protein
MLCKLQEVTKQRDELAEALHYLMENTETPPDRNCRCHINPPCCDCVNHGGLREAIDIAHKALAATKGGEA